MVERELLRIEEAAEALGCSRSHLAQLIAEGSIPSVRLGRARRVPVAALRLWIAAQAVAGPAESEETSSDASKLRP
ncbi:MAG: excisionase family DNA-binding protein [Candidatus Limnocylindrales bacterium]